MAEAKTEQDLPSVPWSQEAGETGLRGATPREGWIYQEFLSRLRGRQGTRAYREMSENDPIVGAVLFAYEMLLKSVQWFWTPADDSMEAKTVKDGFEEIFNHKMDHSWGDHVEEALQMLTFGFMLMEIVLKPIETDAMGEIIGIRKLAPRSPDTVWRWYFDDNGGVIGVAQQRQYGRVVDLPITKLLHYKTVSKLGNPEGRSILRNAYTSYVKKQIIEDAEGKAATRAAGLAVFRIPQRFLDPNAPPEDLKIRSQWEALGKEVGRDRRAHLLLSSKTDASGKYEYSVEYITADTQTSVDHTAIITRHDQRIAQSMLADFLLLGHEKVGSFALSENKTDFFATAVGAVADNIVEPINRQLVPLLMEMNGIDPALAPKLEHSDLRMLDAEVMANVATMLASSGFEGVLTPEVAAAIMKTAKLPVPKQVSDVG